MSSIPSWQKMSTKELLKHPRVPVVEDTVELPDGTKTFYARIPAQDAVTVIMRRNDGKILLNQEYRYATDERLHRADYDKPHDGTLLHFPGGMVIGDERPQLACDREIQEETGIILTGLPKVTLGSVFNYFPRMTSRDYKYFVSLPDSYRQTETSRDREELTMRQIWLDEVEINRMIVGNDQRIMHSHFLDCWALFTIKISPMDL